MNALVAAGKIILRMNKYITQFSKPKNRSLAV